MLVKPCDTRPDGNGAASRALSGAWLGLAIVLVANRARVLAAAEAASGAAGVSPFWAPVASYQDLLLVGLLAVAGGAALRRLERPLFRLLVVWAGIGVALACALYSAIATEVFATFGTPLTNRILALSDGLRGVRASLLAAATAERVAMLLAAPAFVGAVAAWAYRRAALERRVPSARSIVAVSAGCALLAVATLPEPASEAVANPHVVLLASLLERERALPASIATAALVPSGSQGMVRPPTPLGGSLAGSNVLLVVLESAGAKHLAPWGGGVDAMPELTRLAGDGVLFERVYAQQPRSSAAMASLFCSLSPWSRRQSIPRAAHAVAVPGLADVLAMAGYRSAFLHSGDLSFDDERDFLAAHGFATVLDASDLLPARARPVTPSPAVDSAGSGDRESLRAARRERRRVRRRERERFGQLADRALVAPALQWLDLDPATPFLLVVWTIQAHHPYVNVGPAVALAPDDAERNRYLNALREADRMLAELLQALRLRGLLDTTLVVVTGDHGEAFGEHGVRFHGRSLHDEEVLVPLVLSHPALKTPTRRIATVGQQIDVAPTVADLLGLGIPDLWQGRSLWASERSDRAFLVNVFDRT